MPGIPLDRVYLQEPHWANWMIVVEMFIAGVAAGTYAAYALIGLARNRQDRGVAHLLGFIPMPLMLLVALLLIVDLGQPLRFHHLLFTHPAALGERPGPFFLNPASPMSWATYLLPLFGLFTAIAFLDSLAHGGSRQPRERKWPLEALAHNPIVLAIGGLVAIAMAAYPGVMLNVMQQTVWTDSILIGALYVAMAALSGMGVAALVARWARAPSTAQAVRDALLWIAIVNAVLIALFLISISQFVAPVVISLIVAPVFWLGVVVIGLAIPIWLLISRRANLENVALAGGLALVGALAFRYSVLYSAVAALQG
jgi:formate-dependent nitrite reductase membrane component NrfD